MRRRPRSMQRAIPVIRPLRWPGVCATGELQVPALVHVRVSPAGPQERYAYACSSPGLGAPQVLGRLSSCMPRPEASGGPSQPRLIGCSWVAFGGRAPPRRPHQAPFRSWTSTSGGAVTPAASRRRCLRFAHLVRSRSSTAPPWTQDSLRVGGYPLPDMDLHLGRDAKLCLARYTPGLSRAVTASAPTTHDRGRLLPARATLVLVPAPLVYEPDRLRPEAKTRQGLGLTEPARHHGAPSRVTAALVASALGGRRPRSVRDARLVIGLERRSPPWRGGQATCQAHPQALPWGRPTRAPSPCRREGARRKRDGCGRATGARRRARARLGDLHPRSARPGGLAGGLPP